MQKTTRAPAALTEKPEASKVDETDSVELETEIRFEAGRISEELPAKRATRAQMRRSYSG